MGSCKSVRLLGAAALLLALLGGPGPSSAAPSRRVKPQAPGLLACEKLGGRGVWVDPFLTQRLEKANRVRATIWFNTQFLGDGKAYLRRAKELKDHRRGELRQVVTKTLKALSEKFHGRVSKKMAKLEESGAIRAVDRHWIINGFSCGVTKQGLKTLSKLPGVRKIFATRWGGGGSAPKRGAAPGTAVVSHPPFDAARYKHPWYVRQLLADKVWAEFGVTGKGTLNVVHDFNFLFSPNVNRNVYRNPKEIPFNDKDDDGNGLVDDYHGYNFDHDSGALTVQPVGPAETHGAKMHGFMCAAIICGAGAKGHEYEFGIAPEGQWAGIASSRRLERAIEWAIEQGADTYSMSFSNPNQDEYRSHRRKVMEQGAFCGLYFVSGAGNFAQEQEVPVQMRQPEDIPEAVFAAAGVQRDLRRTAFSSKGPVLWETEHYQDGSVAKPAVCAFNANLPFLQLDGGTRPGGLGGNSFAGPMFCGSIALMLSADPELLPWDLRAIITSTAMDVAGKGYDDETGHGLINCYRAVKEVLRRKAKREGRPTKPYTGRTLGDTLDVEALAKQLEIEAVVVMRLGPKGQAKALGVKRGDAILTYGGQEIHGRADLRAAKQQTTKAERKEIPVVFRRGDEQIELLFESGPLGINIGVRYKEPVFR